MQVHDIIQSAEIFIKDRLSSDFSDGHDFDHTCRVVAHALELCDQIPQADRQIVHLAALLHDVARPEEARSNGAVDHAAQGAVVARSFLMANSYPHEKLERVVRCIAEHRFRSGNQPSSIEAQILFDADKLDSLGAVGIARSFFFAARVGARIHNSAQDALAGMPYSCQDTAYREYLVKLSKLPDRMFTIQAKLKARNLKIFMQHFFEQLNSEFF